MIYAGQAAMCPVCVHDTTVAAVYGDGQWKTAGPVRSPTDDGRTAGVRLECECRFFVHDAWVIDVVEGTVVPGWLRARPGAQPYGREGPPGSCPHGCGAAVHDAYGVPFCPMCDGPLPWVVCPHCGQTTIVRMAGLPLALRFAGIWWAVARDPDCCRVLLPTPLQWSSGWLPDPNQSPNEIRRMRRVAHMGTVTWNDATGRHAQDGPLYLDVVS